MILCFVIYHNDFKLCDTFNEWSILEKVFIKDYKLYIKGKRRKISNMKSEMDESDEEGNHDKRNAGAGGGVVLAALIISNNTHMN